jgi:hypothetical protein
MMRFIVHNIACYFRMVKIITVATKSDYYFPYLKESIKRNGSELIVLGYNEVWQGFNWRFSYSRDCYSY